MRHGLTGPLSLPLLHRAPQGPYLGLLKERAPLFILDVCDLALLHLERGSQAHGPGRRRNALSLHSLPSAEARPTWM